jgi:bifunctional non-homologous end joining protein LigD
VATASLDPASLRPMLAVAGGAGDVGRDHTYEFKWDGVRALAFVDGDGSLDLRSRKGIPVAARYPELAGVAEAAGRPVVLDGEIVALDDGWPPFVLCPAATDAPDGPRPCRPGCGPRPGGAAAVRPPRARR